MKSTAGALQRQHHSLCDLSIKLFVRLNFYDLPFQDVGGDSAWTKTAKLDMQMQET